MFGMEKLAALTSPEMGDLIESLPAKVKEWSDFLARLATGQKRIDESQERIENNLAFIVSQNEDTQQKLLLLMSAGNITPELQHEVEAMATTDPRNAPSTEILNEAAIA